MKQHALKIAELGIPIFPVKGKVPMTSNGFKAATTDEDTVASWWTKYPEAGIGMPTGPASGVWVLDIDGEIGRWTLADMICNNGPLPPTVHSRTGGGGDHYFFKWHDGVKNSASVVGPKVDVRGDGGYVVLPPSPHPSGQRYEWERDFFGSPAAEAPDWLLEAAVDGKDKLPLAVPRDVGNPIAYASAALTKECLALAKMSADSGRNHALNKAAFKIGRYVSHGYITVADAEERLTNAARESGLEEQEILPTIRSGLGVWPLPPKELPKAPGQGRTVRDTSPMRLAEDFLETKKVNGRLGIHKWRGEFYRYNGKCYEEFENSVLEDEVWLYLDGVYHLSGKDNEVKKYCPNINAVSNVVRALCAIPGVAIERGREAPFFFSGKDASYMMSIKNGIVQLLTGEVVSHTPDFFTLNTIPAAYREDVRPPVECWSDFLESVWPEHSDDEDEPGQADQGVLLQEWMGYCLAPDTSQHKIMFMVGAKRGGKGTISRILTALVGQQNVANPSLSDYTRDFGLAPLANKLIALTPDAHSDKTKDTALAVERLLSISGEDHITINKKYRDAYSAKLPARIIIMCNAMPSFIDASGAIASRCLTLRFNESFVGKEDIHLGSKLSGEIDGVFAWAVDGLRRLKGRGYFAESQASKDERDEFLELVSPVSSFVNDYCEQSPANAMTCARMYEEWQKWCKMNGVEEIGNKSWFGRNLRAAVPRVKRKLMRLQDGAPYRWCYKGIQTNKAS